jgi:hypothetical protein
VFRRQLHDQFDGQAAHTGHSPHGSLHGVLLGEGGEVAGQRDHAIRDCDADGGSIDGRVPCEFGADFGLKFGIGFHLFSP